MDEELQELKRKVQASPDDPFARFEYHIALRKCGQKLPPIESEWIDIPLQLNFQDSDLRCKIQGDLVLLCGEVHCSSPTGMVDFFGIKVAQLPAGFGLFPKTEINRILAGISMKIGFDGSINFNEDEFGIIYINESYIRHIEEKEER